MSRSSCHPSHHPPHVLLSIFLPLVLLALLLPFSTSLPAPRRTSVSSLRSPSLIDPQADLELAPPPTITTISSPTPPPSTPVDPFSEIPSIYQRGKSAKPRSSFEDINLPLSPPSSADPGAASVTTPDELGQGCLTREGLSKAKGQLKTRLLNVLDQYVAVWKLEDKSADELTRLYDAKAAELKEALKAKKAELMAKACLSGAGRRLLGNRVDDADWFERDDQPVAEEDVATERLGSEDVPPTEDDDRGVVAGIHAARIIAGGAQEEPSDDDPPLMDASIHPYNPHPMPSAFTELSQRDIQSRHAPTSITPPRVEPYPDVDYENGGFLASITPARLAAVASSEPSRRRKELRSQRDIDEDYEEDKRKRRERLSAMRSSPSPDASSPDSSRALTDEDYDSGHFIASISPMAPQRSSPHFDEDASFIGSIGPPSSNGKSRQTVLERWKEQDAKEEAKRLFEEHKASSRSRLEAIAARAKDRAALHTS